MEEIFYKPKSVRIEASSVCQLHCECCYMRLNEDNATKKGFLKFEDFKKFVDANDYIKSIELSNSGEIFLNPDLAKIIEYAYEKNIELTAYNGVNLNTVSSEVLESLVKYKFKRLTISIDGASQETYSIYRRGGDFDTVISNIKKINEYKKKYNSEYPHLTYQFIIFGHNEKDIPKARALADELDMQINFKYNWNPNYSPIKDEEFVRRETNLTAVSVQEFIEKEKTCYIKSSCVKMWTQPQINWDGRLLGCCCVFNEDYGVNVFAQGLKKALTSEKYMYAKKMLMNKAESKEDIPCSRCDKYIAMQKTSSFVTEKEILEYL